MADKRGDLDRFIPREQRFGDERRTDDERRGKAAGPHAAERRQGAGTRRRSPDRRRLLYGVKFSTSEAVSKLESWLDARCVAASRR